MANKIDEKAQAYQHRFLHIFMSLFFFYVVALFVVVTAYLLVVARPLYFEFLTNPYIWMLYAPGPLFIGMSLSLLFAGIVQWNYSCKAIDGKIVCKDSLGRRVVVNPDDILQVRTYEVPFMPLSRINIGGARCSVWIPKRAAMDLVKLPNSAVSS